MKKILFAASEAVPFIKTGGLADVAGTLPKSFNKEEFDVRVVMPKYRVIPERFQSQMEYMTNFYVNLAGRMIYAGVFRMVLDGVTFYFIDNEYYFSGDKIYEDGLWDLEKFAYFSKAALTMLCVIDFRPDIIHCHDWQTGLMPVYLKNEFWDSSSYSDFYQNMKAVMTIHNLKFQGTWNIDDMMRITGLPGYLFTSDKLEAYHSGNYLKGGLVYADWITTVSEVYANEIKYPFYGEGLDGLMRARSNNLSGIVNGIDYDEYNPETDELLVHNYTPYNFRTEKIYNKLALQEELGLAVDGNKFMIGLVSRLTDQKGLDLIDCVMEQICSEDVQFVILGTGDPRYENMFRYYEWKYPERVSASICYDNTRSHRIYAACDAFLMPSLFEPCGLSQLMSLRYGTLPIVRETGGLKETVEPYNEYVGSGNGFSFANYNAHEMLHVIEYAKSVYYERRLEWNKIVDRAMAADFSWDASARKYEDLYRSL
ncbi:MAG: glycogen synthase GlgA [Coprococcus sp.]